MNTENNGIVTFIVFIVLAIGLSLSTCCPEIACERRILIYCTAPERTGISIAVTMITAAGRPKDPLFEIICVGEIVRSGMVRNLFTSAGASLIAVI